MTEARTRWLVALLGAAAFSFESWALGPYSWMYAYGAGVETIPLHLALHYDDRLFSPWAPFIAGGLDRYAFAGGADPLNWETVFIALFPPWLANGLHRFVQYFIAIFFTEMLCHRQLGLERGYSLLGGVLYACFSYFTFGEMLGIPALPLFLLLMQALRERSKSMWLPLLTGLAFSTFTTFPHTLPYLALFAALWSALVRKDVSARAIVNWGLMVFGLSIGDAPQLLSALANGPFSHRSAFHPELIEWSINDLFYRQLRFDYFNQDALAKKIAWDLPLPVLTAGVVMVGLMRLARGQWSPQSITYLRVYAVYFLLSQRWLFVASQNFVGEWIPWIRGIYMGRFFDVPASLLIACQFALLVSLIVHSLGSWKWPKRLVHVGVLAFVVFMLVRPKVFLSYRIGVDGWGQLNYQVQSLERLMKSQTEPFRVASVLPLQPGYAYAQGFETVDGWANLYPKVYRQYWLQVLGPLFANVPGAKQIFDPDSGRPQDHYIFLGADLTNPTVGALPGEDASQALKEGFDVEHRFDLKLLGLLNVKYLLSELPLKGRGIELVHAPADPPRVARSRDWATGRIVDPPSEPHGPGLLAKVRNAFADLHDAIRLKAAGKDVYIYRLEAFVPRFRFVDELRLEPDGRRVLESLAASPVGDLRRVAVAEAASHPGPNVRRYGAGTLHVVPVGPHELRFEVRSPANAFLAIGMTWSPYWRAQIDGRSAKLSRINHTQMGLEVPAGTSDVRLRYLPPYFSIFQSDFR